MFDQLKRAIDKTVSEFRAHPADFLSENDIQAVLFLELRNEMRSIRMHYGTSCEKDRCFGDSLDISPVMTEYWLGAEGPCDIAVLGGDDPESPNLWRQSCRIGIEIKFWQALERHTWKEPRGPQRDVDKLQRYRKKRNVMEQQFTGVAMLFCHPGASRCQEVDEIAGTDPEAAYPEDGIAIHVVSEESHRWVNAAVSQLTAIAASTTD